MSWSSYVKRMTRGQTQQQVADQIKVADQTTVGRWRRGTHAPKDPAVVAAFAEAYGGNVLEAFVAAGFLTREEAGMPAAHGVDFETLVDTDDSLSENAKVHLKNQYGLLRAASAVERTHALHESIVNDPELDDATKTRLLASFDSTDVTTVYTSTATVIEHPFATVLPGAPVAHQRLLSDPADMNDDAVAAHEEDAPIAGEQESPTEP